MSHIRSVPLTVRNPHGEDLQEPCIVVANHQSMLDTAYLMAFSPRIVLLAALTHPRCRVTAYEQDDDLRAVATYAAEGIAPNLTFLPKSDMPEVDVNDNNTIIL